MGLQPRLRLRLGEVAVVAAVSSPAAFAVSLPLESVVREWLEVEVVVEAAVVVAVRPEEVSVLAGPLLWVEGMALQGG